MNDASRKREEVVEEERRNPTIWCDDDDEEGEEEEERKELKEKFWVKLYFEYGRLHCKSTTDRVSLILLLYVHSYLFHLYPYIAQGWVWVDRL